jgi:hypothetical protein
MPTLQSHTHWQATQAVAQPETYERASTFPALVTAFQNGFRITHGLFFNKGVLELLRLFAHAQKSKINLCFVGRLVQFEFEWTPQSFGQLHFRRGAAFGFCSD